MIFKVRRGSGLPLMLEPEEVRELRKLEEQGRWTEYDYLQKELRGNDDLKEITIEVATLAELKLFLITIDDENTFDIDFEREFITIRDEGRDH